MSKIKRVKVTPEIAEKLLQKNSSNRPLSSARIDTYAYAMKTGQWNENTGQTLSIREDGVLTNGQHRLNAIIRANRPIYMDIAYGVDDNAYLFTDTHKARTGGDAFAVAFDEIEAPYKKFTMIKTIINLQNGQIHQAAHNYSRGSTQISPKMAVDFYQKNFKSLEESFSIGAQEENLLVSPSLLGAFHYLFKTKGGQKATDFCNQFASGESLAKTSVIKLLRSKLIADTNRKTTKTKMGQTEKMALIIKAWNCYKDGKTLTLLKWTPTEGFPKF